jgi:predicted MFS family arabinose efflux permease
MFGPPRDPGRGRFVALVILFGAATAVATQLQSALSVLSSFIIEEFDITRSQFGVCFSAFSITSAVSSPLLGRLADLSTRWVMTGLFVVAAVGGMAAAAAPAFVWVVVAAVIGGLGLGAANPVTNKLISRDMEEKQHGIVIGIKQAGPPLGLLATGLVLPPIAVLLNWRVAMMIMGLSALLGPLATHVLIPAEGRRPHVERAEDVGDAAEERIAVAWLTVLSSAMAVSAGALIAFFPLYVQEEIGLSASVAGILAAMFGITGAVGRVFWAAIAGRFRHTTVPLAVLGAVAFFSIVLIWLSRFAPWLVWIGSFAAGSSVMAWHAIAWFALVATVNTAAIGRASGVVTVGNSLGFALGPPLLGALIDSTGGYELAWGTVAGLLALTVLATIVWGRGVEGRRSAGV